MRQKRRQSIFGAGAQARRGAEPCPSCVIFQQRFDRGRESVGIEEIDQQRVIEVDDELESDIGFLNPTYRRGTSYQSPRYAQFTVTLDF